MAQVGGINESVLLLALNNQVSVLFARSSYTILLAKRENLNEFTRALSVE